MLKLIGMGPWRWRCGSGGAAAGRERAWGPPAGTWRGPGRWWGLVLLLLLLGAASSRVAGAADFASTDIGGGRQQEETASAELEDYIHGLEEGTNTANSSM